MAELLTYGQYYSEVLYALEVTDRDQPEWLESLRDGAQHTIEEDGAELLPGPCRRAEVPDHHDGLPRIVYYIWPAVRAVRRDA